MKQAGNGLNIVILDACRNNPFKSFSRSMNKGLKRVSGAEGTIIAYATSPGKVAYDGKGQNSPYTKQLIKQMKEPNVPVELMFKKVRKGVKLETNGKQSPWYEASIDGDFYFKSFNSGFLPSKKDKKESTIDLPFKNESWVLFHDSEKWFSITIEKKGSTWKINDIEYSDGRSWVKYKVYGFSYTDESMSLLLGTDQEPKDIDIKLITKGGGKYVGKSHSKIHEGRDSIVVALKKVGVSKVEYGRQKATEYKNDWANSIVGNWKVIFNNISNSIPNVITKDSKNNVLINDDIEYMENVFLSGNVLTYHDQYRKVYLEIKNNQYMVGSYTDERGTVKYEYLKLEDL